MKDNNVTTQGVNVKGSQKADYWLCVQLLCCTVLCADTDRDTGSSVAVRPKPATYLLPLLREPRSASSLVATARSAAAFRLLLTVLAGRMLKTRANVPAGAQLSYQKH